MNKENIFDNSRGLFKKVEKSRFKPIWIIALLIALGMMLVNVIITVVLTIVPTMIEMINNGLFTNPELIATELVSDSLLLFTYLISVTSLIIIVFIYVKFIEKRKISSIGFFKKNAIKNYLIGLIAGFITFTTIVLITWKLGYLELIKVTNESYSSVVSWPLFLVVILFWLIQGASEEIFVRGWLFPIIGKRHNVPIAIILSSLFFTALHLGNPNTAIVPLVNLTLFGVFACFYVIRFEDLWGICAFHSIWNWVQGNLFGIKVSGDEFPGGSIFNFHNFPTSFICPITGNNYLFNRSFNFRGKLCKSFREPDS